MSVPDSFREHVLQHDAERRETERGVFLLTSYARYWTRKGAERAAEGRNERVVPTPRGRTIRWRVERAVGRPVFWRRQWTIAAYHCVVPW